MEKQRYYLCIDMKCFFASVECAERGLNPFETNLVVADETRGRGSICLAISPKMKSLGVKNRCRVYEIPHNIEYITAKPRMAKYIEYAADIYEIYLGFVAKEDIHVYSIDEAFLDVTEYLDLYELNAEELAERIINRIAQVKRIPATAGIGTNLYLAKIALDITAKHSRTHIGFLDEELFIKTLWKHRPLSDFWGISAGTCRRLRKYNVYDMEGIAKLDERFLYKEFGVNAEILIDHAYGREPCLMKDIKGYKAKSHSISTSQILFEDYDYDKAKIVIEEMALNCCQRLMKEKRIARSVGVFVGYSRDTVPSSGGVMKMSESTNVFSIIMKYVVELYEKHTDRTQPIRRLMIDFGGLCDESCAGYDLFTDFDKVEKERAGERAVIDIKTKYGKNAIIRGADLQEGATQITRNKLIGGHNGE